MRIEDGKSGTVALAALLAAVGFGLSACGGGSASPGVANAGSSTTTTVAASASNSSGESTVASEELQFAHCMRSHGVLNFPDPSASGGFLNAIAAAHINAQSPTDLAAEGTCKKYSPAGHLTPAQSAAENAKAVQFAQCMRSHRVPNYPEPISGPAGGQAVNLGPEHIDPSSPTFQAAQSACQKVVPGSK
ncbi:MAG: hypothetical protein ACRDZX_08150 [Acidimicrobiales bacterium]